MSFHKYIISSFQSVNQCYIDKKYLGKIKNVRLAFEKKDNPREKFDDFFEHYIILARYNDFWTLEPGKFLYHFNNVERPELFRCRRFEPSSIEEVKKVLEV